jgi:HSP20 family molecular chaperone IbpA
MAELDPEFSSAHKNDDEDAFGEDDTIAQLRDFAAKVDWASSDFSKPLHPARDSTKHDHSQRPKPSVETEVKKAPGSRKQEPGELQRGFMARDSDRAAARAAVRAAKAETFSTSVDRTEDGRVRVVAALDGVASFADVDLDVASSTLRVREKGGRRRSARVELPCDVDAASASAKFSKKRGQLTVVLAPSAD